MGARGAEACSRQFALDYIAWEPPLDTHSCHANANVWFGPRIPTWDSNCASPYVCTIEAIYRHRRAYSVWNIRWWQRHVLCVALPPVVEVVTLCRSGERERDREGGGTSVTSPTCSFAHPGGACDSSMHKDTKIFNLIRHVHWPSVLVQCLWRRWKILDKLNWEMHGRKDKLAICKNVLPSPPPPPCLTRQWQYLHLRDPSDQFLRGAPPVWNASTRALCI